MEIQVTQMIGAKILNYMMEKPPKIEKERDQRSDAEKEVDDIYIESLNKTLAELKPQNIKALNQEEEILLKQAYVVDSSFSKAKKKNEISGIYLEFFTDKKQQYKNNFLSPLSLCEKSNFRDGESNLFDNYRQLLIKLEGVSSRALPEDKKIELLMNLDRTRRALHDRAAHAIQEHLSSEAFGKASVDKSSARLLFEVLYQIWDTPKSNRELTYSEGLLDDVDLEKMEDQIERETGEPVNISFFTYGFHENLPTNQYRIAFVNPVHPEITSKAEAVIAPYIIKAKRKRRRY